MPFEVVTSLSLQLFKQSWLALMWEVIKAFTPLGGKVYQMTSKVPLTLRFQGVLSSNVVISHLNRFTLWTVGATSRTA